MAENTLLVIGATGFTGRLVTQYLSTHPLRDTFKLQLGGRSPSKLAGLIVEFGLKDVQPVAFNLTSEDDVDQAVRGANVVLNCAGPFYKWGTYVVAAAARYGVSYVDITGEGWWIMELIEKYDYLAYKTGATIVPACGYDSLPSDLSAFLSAQALKALLPSGAPIGKSTTAHALSGLASGGTFATAVSAFEDVPKHVLAKSAQPYAFGPVTGKTTKGARFTYSLPASLTRPNIIQGCFFFLSGCNQATVRRTWGLLQREARASSSPSSSSSSSKMASMAYGEDFEYEEFMVLPKILPFGNSLVAAFVSTIIFATGMLLALFPPARWLFGYLIPASGSGPDLKAREAGFYKATNITSSIASPSSPARHVKTVIKGRGDPGYLLTAIMISESALLMLPSVRDTSLTPLGLAGGLLTPMTTFGPKLVEQLKASGRFTFETTEVFETSGRGDGKKLL